jgi:signal transduction histidine kinase
MTLRSLEEIDLVREVLSLRQGDHLCLVYEDDPAAQMPALLPFFRQGLEANEQCIYVADDLELDTLQDMFEDYGIDTEREMGKGALVLWTRDKWRQPGDLDSQTKAAQVRGLIDEALASGFAAIRFGVEMTWTLGPTVDVAKLRHWEATINTIFTPDVPGRIICQYSQRRLSPATIEAALSTHPIAIVGTAVMPNPFYDAPFLLQDQASIGPEQGGISRADWMISQLGWARALQLEREQRIHAQLAERQRIARELHDSVSQALYSILLTGGAARSMLETKPDQVADALDSVVALAEGGLAEMRALLFELRPESLEAEGLVAALQKLSAALHARHGIEVEEDLCDEPDLPLKVKAALWHIGQEALHNVAKHAQAKKAAVALKFENNEFVILEIQDDGRGFDATEVYPGHLGLVSMRERAEELLGQLQIESFPGAGSRVYVRVPVAISTATR